MIPSDPGTYILILKADLYHDLIVGKKGPIKIRPGFYGYAGSAMGPGGLGARIGRHMKKKKLMRWHIDYLRRHMDLFQIWYTLGNKKLECRWAKGLIRIGGTPLEPGLGASDCKCRSHVFYFEKMPSFSSFTDGRKARDVQQLVNKS